MRNSLNPRWRRHRIFRGLQRGASPNAIAAGPDGDVWFTDNSGPSNFIGRITQQGGITEFPAHAKGAQLTGIAAGPDGNLWYTELVQPGDTSDMGSIGRITPNGVVTNFTSSGMLGPRSITAAPDGNLWFAEVANSGQGPVPGPIGRITPAGVITSYPLNNADAGYAATQITAGPDGNLWFDLEEYHVASGVGRMTTAGTVTGGFFSGPAGGISGISGRSRWQRVVRLRSDGFSFARDGVGRITPDGAITAFSHGISDVPNAIAGGPDHNEWFTEPAVNTIGKSVPLAAEMASLPAA